MSLAGRGVLVTRPRELARSFAERIEQAGGRALVFPAIEIQFLPAPEVLARLADYALVVFVSPMSIEAALRHVPRWPEGVRAAAVGSSTRQALERRGVRQVIAPEGEADSEALLALPELNALAGRRVLIVRGEEGRALLGDTLRERGARVEYAACYRRTRPSWDASALLGRWSDVQAVTAFSSETLENLVHILGGAEPLQRTPLFVPHTRIAAAAQRLGVRETVLGGPGEAEMLERLVRYFSR